MPSVSPGEVWMTDFGMAANPVRQPLHFAVPQCGDVREHTVARGVLASDQPLRRFRGFEACLERIDLSQNPAGGFAFDVGGLRDQRQHEQKRSHCTTLILSGTATVPHCSRSTAESASTKGK